MRHSNLGAALDLDFSALAKSAYQTAYQTTKQALSTQTQAQIAQGAALGVADALWEKYQKPVRIMGLLMGAYVVFSIINLAQQRKA